jgi:hypothetical protein
MRCRTEESATAGNWTPVLKLLSPWSSHSTLYWVSHRDQSHHPICIDCLPTVFCTYSLACYFQLVSLLRDYVLAVFIFDALKVIMLPLRIYLFWGVTLCQWVSVSWHFKGPQSLRLRGLRGPSLTHIHTFTKFYSYCFHPSVMPVIIVLRFIPLFVRNAVYKLNFHPI